MKHQACRLALIISLAAVCATSAFAKRTDDVVILQNGDRLTGEIKSLQRGELSFKADYMAEAVRLDWARVERLVSKDKYLIYLTSGQLFTDSIELNPQEGANNFLIGANSSATRVDKMDVIRILPVEARFFQQLEGTVDLGFSFTSGNNQYQTQVSAATTYRRGDQTFSGRIDSAFSGQPQGSRTARNQITFDYRKQISPNWYVGGLADVLQSDQQSLDRRLTLGGLVGRQLLQTERTRFHFLAALQEAVRIIPS